MHAGFAQCGDRLVQIALQNTAMPGNFHRGTAVQSGNMGCQRSQQPREQPRFAGFDLRATSQALRSDTLDMQRRTVRRNPAAHTRMTSTAPTISLQGRNWRAGSLPQPAQQPAQPAGPRSWNKERQPSSDGTREIPRKDNFRPKAAAPSPRGYIAPTPWRWMLQLKHKYMAHRASGRADG